MRSRALVLSAASGMALAAAAANADIINLNPVADTFVSSAQPDGNFGSAGGLSVAAPGLAQGEFQTLIRFDTAPAIAAFNASFGAGNWTVSEVSLVLTSTNANNPVFNTPAAGQFTLSWMQNDTWVEGTGGPSAPSPIGVNFNSLPSFLSAADETLGTFAYSGATSGTVTATTSLAAGFLSDVAAGGPVSLRLFAADASIAWVFNSRNFGTVGSHPVLSITAVPAPGAAGVIGLASLALIRRRR
ncbi:MAG: hypothetical protein KF678_03075 [Phycisphaeraceae bacterium]|nr:hypothetical protein [Phycisphaeraceae bacterium]